MEYPFKENQTQEIHNEFVNYTKSYFYKPECIEFLKLCGNLKALIDLDAISFHYLKRTNKFLNDLINLKSITEKTLLIDQVKHLCAVYLEESQNAFYFSKELDELYNLGIDTANFDKNYFSNFILDFLEHFFKTPKEETEWWLYERTTNPNKKDEPRFYYSINGVEGDDVDVTKSIDFINFQINN